MGIRIDALDAAIASRSHVLPVMKDNATAKLSVDQIIDLIDKTDIDPILATASSDDTLDDTDVILYQTGSTTKKGTLTGLISSIFKTARTIASAQFAAASFKLFNAAGTPRSLQFVITALTADRTMTFPDGNVVVPSGTLASLTGAQSLTATALTDDSSVAVVRATNGTVDPIAVRNTSSGSSAMTRLLIGNDSDAADFRITLNGSANVGGVGSRSVELTANGGPMRINNTGILYVPAVYTQTTATAANVNVNTAGELRRVSSSLKYKDNIEDYGRGLADALKLRPVLYTSRTDGGDKRYPGFIAEEVDAAGLSEFVEYDAEGNPDALFYPSMVVLLQAAIRDLNARIEALEG